MSIEEQGSKLFYTITRTWNNQDTGHVPIQLTLQRADERHVQLTISAPFFNDPPNPGGTPGKPFPQLWDYEVVEAFFLADDGKYLELEFCPHGQHLVLLLNGKRKILKDQLPLKFSSSIHGNVWSGEAYIPVEYFPPKVSKFNAYAIHGSETSRQYEALYPITTGQHQEPDFHRLEYFQKIEFQSIVDENWSIIYTSSYWEI
ncbi:hypothetical protein CHS0354_012911 [Potamilus streckersoni]|uniref:Uncharacterized protein n=1 Tax=Potamilus streckersoni TaxID=2493646 RepID=A0AAE0VGK7_9BIVA|nr:hypothetical protein CHS0354_012911 [Potamilus streckersoni]